MTKECNFSHIEEDAKEDGQYVILCSFKTAVNSHMPYGLRLCDKEECIFMRVLEVIQ